MYASNLGHWVSTILYIGLYIAGFLVESSARTHYRSHLIVAIYLLLLLPYRGRSFYFHIQRVTNITLLMSDTQIPKGIVLHSKVKPFVIIYQNFNVDRVVLCVLLTNQKRHLTITTRHCEISLNEPLEYGKLGGHY
ncbi:hypothetical protein Hdeb2414_s0010g00349851 [Helianthus debilis subsp. tardiflorus]